MRQATLMNKCTLIPLLGLVLGLSACQKSDEPVIPVNTAEVPKPTDESGHVEMVERTFAIKLSAPTPAWSVKISEIWVVGQEIWVVATLTEAEADMVIQKVTTISDSVSTSAPDIEARTFLIGKTGGWQPSAPGVSLIYSRDAIATGLEEGFQIWPKS